MDNTGGLTEAEKRALRDVIARSEDGNSVHVVFPFKIALFHEKKVFIHEKWFELYILPTPATDNRPVAEIVTHYESQMQTLTIERDNLKVKLHERDRKISELEAEVMALHADAIEAAGVKDLQQRQDASERERTLADLRASVDDASAKERDAKAALAASEAEKFRALQASAALEASLSASAASQQRAAESMAVLESALAASAEKLRSVSEAKSVLEAKLAASDVSLRRETEAKAALEAKVLKLEGVVKGLMS